MSVESATALHTVQNGICGCFFHKQCSYCQSQFHFKEEFSLRCCLSENLTHCPLAWMYTSFPWKSNVLDFFQFYDLYTHDSEFIWSQYVNYIDIPYYLLLHIRKNAKNIFPIKILFSSPNHVNIKPCINTFEILINMWTIILICLCTNSYTAQKN